MDRKSLQKLTLVIDYKNLFDCAGALCFKFRFFKYQIGNGLKNSFKTIFLEFAAVRESLIFLTGNFYIRKKCLFL